MKVFFLPYVMPTLICYMLLGCSGGGSSGSAPESQPRVQPPVSVVPSETSYQPRIWTLGFAVSDPNRQAFNPSVKVLENGQVYATWIEAADEDGYGSVFGVVTRADLNATERARDQLKPVRLNIVERRAERPVLSADRWNQSFGTQERYLPLPQLAVAPSGVALVTWLEKHPDNDIQSVWVATYDPIALEWSLPMRKSSANSSSDESKLVTLASGDIILLWKESAHTESEDQSNALQFSRYNVTDNTWGPVLTIDRGVKAQAEVVVWERQNTPVVAYLKTVDENHDQLLVADWVVGTGGFAEPKQVDESGVKEGLAAIAFQDHDILLWSKASDQNGFVLTGVSRSQIQTHESSEVQAADTPETEVLAGDPPEGQVPNSLVTVDSAATETIEPEWVSLPLMTDVGYGAAHKVMAKFEDKLHLVWQSTSFAALNGQLHTLVYDKEWQHEVSTTPDWHANIPIMAPNPVVVSDKNKLYVQWFANQLLYLEYLPGQGWQKLLQPFCNPEAFTAGILCTNRGTHHSFDVAGSYGAAVWVKTEENPNVVMLSLSVQ